jgi:hypothetical protein
MLLQEHDFDDEFVETMLAVFMNVCRTMEVSDPADPRASTIARTVILNACEGVRDPQVLYERTLNKIHSG